MRLNYLNNYNSKFSFSASIEHFKIRNMDRIHCPLCGYMMLSEKNIQSFCGDVRDKRGLELIIALEKYKTEDIFSKDGSKARLFNPGQEEILDRVIQTVRLYPQKNFRNILKKLAKDIQKKYSTVKQSVVLEKIRQKTNDPKGEHLLTYPQEFADNFIYKCFSNSSDQGDFFEKFIRMKQISKEHIVPKSTGGDNDLSNYIYDCIKCNFYKGSEPLGKVIKSNPNFEKNLAKYFDEVDNEIQHSNAHNLSYFENYRQNITRKINELCGTKLDINA